MVRFTMYIELDLLVPTIYVIIYGSGLYIVFYIYIKIALSQKRAMFGASGFSFCNRVR